MSGIAGGTGYPPPPPWQGPPTAGKPDRSPGPFLLIGALVIIGSLLGFLAYQSASGKQEENGTGGGSGGGLDSPLYIHAVDSALEGQDCPAAEQSGGTAVFNPATSSCLVLDTATDTMRVDALLEATATYGPSGTWIVGLTFTPEDGARFADLTETVSARPVPQNQLAMVLDGQLLTAPAVTARIEGDQVEISGSFTREEAEDLADRLAP
ncbi:SecDF P1 head subdomain-containing protein [Streptomyces harbinensis]|uniref:SecDF P1 head subdomain-containing protein n=1 Tax=Streptomyces harbinensis TaxID=1176198 RepID=UPI00369231F2